MSIDACHLEIQIRLIMLVPIRLSGALRSRTLAVSDTDVKFTRSHCNLTYRHFG